jgi:hypothetical protein
VRGIVARLRFDYRDRDADEVEEILQQIDRLRAENAALKTDFVVERGHRAAAEEFAERRAETVDRLRAELGRIVAEIDCRIEHGADSNGHLEGLRDLIVKWGGGS